MKEINRFTRDLPVELTLEEIKTKADFLAKLLFDQNDCKEQKAEQNRALNEQIKSLGKTIARVCQMIKEGREYRPVEVVSIGYFENNTVEFIRQDTMERIEVRAMTGEEREAMTQIDIFSAQTDASSREAS